MKSIPGENPSDAPPVNQTDNNGWDAGPVAAREDYSKATKVDSIGLEVRTPPFL